MAFRSRLLAGFRRIAEHWDGIEKSRWNRTSQQLSPRSDALSAWLELVSERVVEAGIMRGGYRLDNFCGRRRTINTPKSCRLANMSKLSGSFSIPRARNLHPHEKNGNHTQIARISLTIKSSFLRKCTSKDSVYHQGS